MPRKKRTTVAEIAEVILNSPFAHTLDEKLRVSLGLSSRQVTERMRQEAREATEKIRNAMNPYRILGVSPDLPFEDIKAIYLTLMKRYHPDGKNPDPKRAAEINRAWVEICRLRGQPKG